MLTPHPTLRFSDISGGYRRSLHAQYSPGELHLTYNARGALYQLLVSLPKNTRDAVLVPAFHCTALVEPIIRAGYRAVFYRVRPDFMIDLEDLRSKCSSRNALIVVVHFFGFPAHLASIVEIARANGSFVVEDCAHSFLSRMENTAVGQQGDFALFSYGKSAPSLVGGGLGVRRPDFTLRHPLRPALLRQLIVIAKRLMEQVAANSPQNRLSKTFHWLDQKRRFRARLATSVNVSAALSAFVDDPYLFSEDLARAKMPSLCRRILESCDWDEITRARQRNYRAWNSSLADTPSMRRVLPDLRDSIVPWAFPVLLENRVQHEQALRLLGVPLFTFGEVLHPALRAFNDRAREDAEDISSRLLLLPIHPQLTTSDIQSCARHMHTYFGKLETSNTQRIDDLCSPAAPALTSGFKST